MTTDALHADGRVVEGSMYLAFRLRATFWRGMSGDFRTVPRWILILLRPLRPLR